MPDFDPHSFNHETLRSLIAAMSEVYELKSDNLIPPNYFLKKIDKKVNPDILRGTIKRWIKHYGFIKTELGDFFFIRVIL